MGCVGQIYKEARRGGLLARSEADVLSTGAFSHGQVGTGARTDLLPPHGDVEFETLYKTFAADVTRVVRRYVKDPHHAEDLAQEVFLRAYRAWPVVRRNQPLWPWLRTIAERVCIDEWRSSQRRPKTDARGTEHAGAEVAAGDMGDLAEVVLTLLRSRTVNDALISLEPRHRRVLMLKELEGLRYKTIAELEGTSIAGVRSTLARARGRFRRHYQALAQQRGLAAIFPVFGFGKLRALRHRIDRSVIWMREVVSTGSIDALGPAGTAQFASGIVMLTVLAVAAGPTIAASAGDVTRFVSDNVGLTDSREASTVSREGAAAVIGSSNADPDKDPELQSPSVDPSAPDDFVGHAPPRVNDAPVRAEPRAITEPNRNVHSIEDVTVQSFDFSEDGSVVFAAARNKVCEAKCPALLLRSDDRGASWVLLAAAGFDGSEILLPPAFGAGDDRIFAVTPTGILQVSKDGGVSFETAAHGSSAITNGSAAISPGFNSGDPRILIGTRSGLVQYSDNSKTMGPASYSVTGSDLKPAFASPQLLFVGGVMPNETRRWGSTVFRCESSVCEPIRLSDDSITPRIRISPDFDRSGVVYAFAGQNVLRSSDFGRSFTQIGSPGTSGEIRDLRSSTDGTKLIATISDLEGDRDNGIWTSSDGGGTWLHVDGSVLAGGATSIGVTSDRYYAALSDAGVACSPDGLSWARRC